MPKFDPAPILDRIKVLSSDEFEGRAPGTKGEELTVKYLEDEFKKLGLQPGNTDGTLRPEGAARRHHRRPTRSR